MKPILRSRPELWDQRLTTYPTPVYQSEGVYYLLFRGMTNSHRNQGLGLATSRDLIHWKRHEKSDQKPIIATSEEIGSMAVVHDGKRYVGISQPIDLTKRRYWFSKDLIHWKKGPPVRFRASIAAETLSNPFLVGDTWTVLYEQKDRIYRAVLMPQSTLPK